MQCSRLWARFFAGAVALVLFLGAAGVAGAQADPAAYAALRQQNGGRLAERRHFIPSTAQAVVFTFGGLSKRAPLQAILDNMAANGMGGTFFVTERELARNRANIDLIHSYGQDLGIGLAPIKGGTFADYCAEIEHIRNTLARDYGVSTNFVRLMAPAENDDLVREAVAAEGCVILGQGLSAVQSKHKDAQSPEEIMPQIFGKWTTSLNRGEVVYIRTDFYTRDDLVPALMMEIKRAKVDNIGYQPYSMEQQEGANSSTYRIVSANALAAMGEYTYAYPAVSGDIPPELSLDHREVEITRENFQQEFFKRYVGAPEVGANDRMLGFTRREIALCDHTGIIKTVADNTVFLTFDDWGNDESINKLLYVLRKHNVHGTFFIITRSLDSNPNLLRAIAAEGNEIGSHTHNHRPMTVQDARGLQIPVMTPEEYDADVKASYEHLAKTVGDMRLAAGRPALTRLLRPPTLAVSRTGVESILKHGFTYIVNGSGSTEDYSAVSMQSLVGIMNHLTHMPTGEVRRGAVVVMHMSTMANRTAQALDILLTENDLLPESDPKKFKVGLLGDYLKDGYSQMTKQVPPRKE